ncbi:MAG: hypothetical protein HC881_20575 [Leptolyngbyaceae cyanobacterium SL_7_1]|nr:hypothetical protein [Leptolyngbyaceae cyanobacterium SL_7_1]
MDSTLARVAELKEAFLEFVYEAEGDLAIALEAYTADRLAQMSKVQQQGTGQRDLVVDSFLTKGRVNGDSPIDRFLAEQPDLVEGDRALLCRWHHNFTGLFAITQVLPTGFEVMNWMTAKSYTVLPNPLTPPDTLARLKEGEIVLTRLAPIDEATWTFFSPLSLLGKLSKPKLAVAIGNFKDNHKDDRYGDAPDLLEEAWKSVEVYHEEFVEFFGADEITLSGYELSKRFAEFQQVITQRRLAEAGLDGSKSLNELAQEADLSDDAMASVAETLGTSQETIAKAMQHPAKMAPPRAELPPHLKKAEQVTVLTHPRWGQQSLTTYRQFKTQLEAGDTGEVATRLTRQYLESAEVSTFVWQRLAAQYPTQLEVLVRLVLNRPDFDIAADLEATLQTYNKPLQPDLPEIASVPLHLNALFQDALQEVEKSRPKAKGKQKTGFGVQKL